MNNSSGSGSDVCGTRPLTPSRTLVVVFVGTTLSVASTVANCIAFSVIALKTATPAALAASEDAVADGDYHQGQQRHRRHQHQGDHYQRHHHAVSGLDRSVYLKLLIFSDIIVSAFYVPLIVLGKLEVTGQYELSVNAYWFFFLPFLVSAHVFKMLSTYLIVLMTFERLLIVMKWRVAIDIARRHRAVALIAVVIFVLFTKAPLYFELTILDSPHCDGLEAKRVDQSTWALDTRYHTYYMFYFRNIFGLFVPFSLLAVMNALIVIHLKRQERQAGLFRFVSNEHKARVRSATLMLVLVVCTYLICNMVNFIITVLEHFIIRLLMKDYRKLYMIASDTVPVFSVLACLLRFPVYVLYDVDVRHELKRPFRALRRFWPHENLVINSIAGSRNSDAENNNVEPNKTPQNSKRRFQKWSGSEFDRLTVLIAFNVHKRDTDAEASTRGTAV